MPAVAMTPAQLAKLERAPSDLRRIAYVFVHGDRVLGFHGTVGVSGRTARLASFLAGCTQVGAPSRELAALFEPELERAGWAASGCRRHRLGEYSLDILLEPARTHFLLSLGSDGDKLANAHMSICRERTRRARARRGGDVHHAAASVATVEQLAGRLRGRPVVVYTGAGLSLASGIPTFTGSGSLDERVPLDEPFPGEALAQMIGAPEWLAVAVLGFQLALMTTGPNAGHRALERMRRGGSVTAVVSTNMDRHHQSCGTPVLAPDAFLRREWPGAALLVVGVRIDDRGIVGHARAGGAPVAAIDTEPPTYLRRGDLLCRGDALAILPELARLLE